MDANEKALLNEAVNTLDDFTQQELRKPLLERSAGFEFKLKPKKG